MSRIGKLPIVIPDGVQAKLDGDVLEIKGNKGTLTRKIHQLVNIEIADKVIRCTPKNDKKETRALWGLYRVLIQNMVTGVNDGYKKELEIVGVGYKAELKGKDLFVSAGHSSPVKFETLPGVNLKTEGATRIVVEGIDKQAVGQVAADIRRIRKPEPYKGKGIRYAGEQIKRKAGKAAGK